MHFTAAFSQQLGEMVNPRERCDLLPHLSGILQHQTYNLQHCDVVFNQPETMMNKREAACQNPPAAGTPQQLLCSHFVKTISVRQSIQFTLLEMPVQVLCKQTQEPLVSGTESVPTFVSSCTNQRALKSSLGIAACCHSLLLLLAFSSEPFIIE